MKINVFLLLLLFSACKNSKNSTTEAVKADSPAAITETVDVKNSKETIDWEGIYQGEWNCQAPCESIQTTLFLSKDGSYVYHHKEMGIPDGEKHMNGSFKWDIKGRYISLQGNDFQDRLHYLVDQGRLRRMGDMKEELFTEKSATLDLVKVKNPLEDTQWELTEINGQSISNESELNLKLTFQKDGKFYCSGGCNSIMGGYNINDKMQIQFFGMFSSEKECTFQHYDEALTKALESSRNYILRGEEELQLTIGKRAPFAKFRSSE